MAEVLECKRELIVDKSADEVWEWLSNIRHVMTANQFHLSIDCDEVDALNPRAGLEVPILHEMMGRQFIRVARITKFEDYAISWGERVPDNAGYEDSFPHSEGWRIEPVGPNRCRIKNHLRGRFMLPVGQLVGRYVWDTVMPSILDNDLQDVALAAGAIDQRSTVETPPESAALLRLVQAREIDGKPANEFLNIQVRLAKHSAPEHL